MPLAAEIRQAMLRLSSIALKQFQYDPTGQEFGDGPIHYLVEIDNLLFIAWEDNDTGMIVINPITCFDLDELEELGSYEMWTVIHLSTILNESVQFREIENSELNFAYKRSESHGYSN